MKHPKRNSEKEIVAKGYHSACESSLRHIQLALDIGMSLEHLRALESKLAICVDFSFRYAEIKK